MNKKYYIYNDGNKTTTYYEDDNGIYTKIEDHKNNRSDYEYKIKNEKYHQKELRKNMIQSIIGIIITLILMYPIFLLLGAIFTYIVIPICLIAFISKLILVIYATIKSKNNLDDYNMFIDLEDEQIINLENQLRNSKLYQKAQSKQKIAPIKEAEQLSKTYKKSK